MAPLLKRVKKNRRDPGPPPSSEECSAAAKRIAEASAQVEQSRSLTRDCAIDAHRIFLWDTILAGSADSGGGDGGKLGDGTFPRALSKLLQRSSRRSARFSSEVASWALGAATRSGDTHLFDKRTQGSSAALVTAASAHGSAESLSAYLSPKGAEWVLSVALGSDGSGIVSHARVASAAVLTVLRAKGDVTAVLGRFMDAVCNHVIVSKTPPPPATILALSPVLAVVLGTTSVSSPAMTPVDTAALESATSAVDRALKRSPAQAVATISAIVSALAGRGSTAPSLVAPLVGVLSSSDAAVRTSALGAIRTLSMVSLGCGDGTVAAEAVGALVSACTTGALPTGAKLNRDQRTHLLASIPAPADPWAPPGTAHGDRGTPVGKWLRGPCARSHGSSVAAVDVILSPLCDGTPDALATAGLCEAAAGWIKGRLCGAEKTNGDGDGDSVSWSPTAAQVESCAASVSSKDAKARIAGCRLAAAMAAACPTGGQVSSLLLGKLAEIFKGSESKPAQMPEALASLEACLALAAAGDKDALEVVNGGDAGLLSLAMRPGGILATGATSPLDARDGTYADAMAHARCTCLAITLIVAQPDGGLVDTCAAAAWSALTGPAWQARSFASACVPGSLGLAAGASAASETTSSLVSSLASAGMAHAEAVDAARRERRADAARMGSAAGDANGSEICPPLAALHGAWILRNALLRVCPVPLESFPSGVVAKWFVAVHHPVCCVPRPGYGGWSRTGTATGVTAVTEATGTAGGDAAALAAAVTGPWAGCVGEKAAVEAADSLWATAEGLIGAPRGQSSSAAAAVPLPSSAPAWKSAVLGAMASLASGRGGGSPAAWAAADALVNGAVRGLHLAAAGEKTTPPSIGEDRTSLADVSARDYCTYLTGEGSLYRDGVVQVARGTPRERLAHGPAGPLAETVPEGGSAKAGTGDGASQSGGAASSSKGGKSSGGKSSGGGKGADKSGGADAKEAALIAAQSHLRRSVHALALRAELCLHVVAAMASANPANLGSQLDTVLEAVVRREISGGAATRRASQWCAELCAASVGAGADAAAALVTARCPVVPAPLAGLDRVPGVSLTGNNNNNNNNNNGDDNDADAEQNEGEGEDLSGADGTALAIASAAAVALRGALALARVRVHTRAVVAAFLPVAELAASLPAGRGAKAVAAAGRFLSAAVLAHHLAGDVPRERVAMCLVAALASEDPRAAPRWQGGSTPAAEALMALASAQPIVPVGSVFGTGGKGTTLSMESVLGAGMISPRRHARNACARAAAAMLACSEDADAAAAAAAAMAASDGNDDDDDGDEVFEGLSKRSVEFRRQVLSAHAWTGRFVGRDGSDNDDEEDEGETQGNKNEGDVASAAAWESVLLGLPQPPPEYLVPLLFSPSRGVRRAAAEAWGALALGVAMGFGVYELAGTEDAFPAATAVFLNNSNNGSDTADGSTVPEFVDPSTGASFVAAVPAVPLGGTRAPAVLREQLPYCPLACALGPLASSVPRPWMAREAVGFVVRACALGAEQPAWDKCVSAALGVGGGASSQPSSSYDPKCPCAKGRTAEYCPAPGTAALRTLFAFLTSRGMCDTSEPVRDAMLAGAMAAAEARCGGDEPDQCERRQAVMDVLSSFLSPSGPVSRLPPLQADLATSSSVVVLGTLSQFLPKHDPRINASIDKLLAALSTPSQEVQACIAKVLPGLVSKMGGDGYKGIVEGLLNVIGDPTVGYAERCGAAFGLGGVVKGAGVGSVKACNIIERLEGLVNDRENDGAREGALLAYEQLSSSLGRFFEPYVARIVPLLLTALGDSKQNVRDAATDATRTIVGKLSAHGAKLVLDTVTESAGAAEDASWKSKRGTVQLLGYMAHLAPKQLSTSLPRVVPLILNACNDTHYRVQEAASLALSEIAGVIKNPEIMEQVPQILDGLTNPGESLRVALQGLVSTSYENRMDPASLALVIPLIRRGLREHSGASATKSRKYALQIAGTMCTLATRDSLSPHLGSLLPPLRALLFDAIPEVRGLCSRAIGALVSGLGDDEGPLATLVPWLLGVLVGETDAAEDGAEQGSSGSSTLQGGADGGTSYSSATSAAAAGATSVERSGAAQALCEILRSVDASRMEALLPRILHHASASSPPRARAGSLSLFVYIPSILKDHFLPHVGVTLPYVLAALADSSEEVRETALRASRTLVQEYGAEVIDVIEGHLRLGGVAAGYRVRMASVVLLGDLVRAVAMGPSSASAAAAKSSKASKSSGANGVPTDVVSAAAAGEEVDDTATEDLVGIEGVMDTLATRIGKPLRDSLLSSIYLLRTDLSAQVSRTAYLVWKSIVEHTTRALIEILPTLIELIVSTLSLAPYGMKGAQASVTLDEDAREIAAASLSDVIAKFGDRPAVFETVLTQLTGNLNHESAVTRQGVCLGLAHVMEEATKDMLVTHMPRVIPAVRRALADESASVRTAAAHAFGVMYENIGDKALQEVILPLLESLRGSGGGGGGGSEGGGTAMHALQEIMASKGEAVLPYLVPVMTTVPVSPFHARAMSALVVVAGQSIERRDENPLDEHVGTVIKALAASATCLTEDGAPSAPVEGRDVPGERRKVDPSLFDTLAENDVAACCEDVAKSCHGPGISDAGIECVRLLSSIDPEARCIGLRAIRHLCLNPHASSERLVPQMLPAVTRMLMDDARAVLVEAVAALQAVISLVPKDDLSDLQPVLLTTIENMVVTGAVRRTRASLVPGFCRVKKGLGPIVPLLLHGLMYGSAEVREQSAKGVALVVSLTSEEALGPFVVQLTGPLIRIMGDRFPWQVKSAILSALVLLLAKGPKVLKPFLPQLQTTFLKALADGSHDEVRARAQKALILLAGVTPRVDQLASDLCALCTSSTSPSVPMLSLAGVFSSSGNAMLSAKSVKLASDAVADLWSKHSAQGDKEITESALRTALGKATGAVAGLCGRRTRVPPPNASDEDQALYAEVRDAFLDGPCADSRGWHWTARVSVAVGLAEMTRAMVPVTGDVSASDPTVSRVGDLLAAAAAGEKAEERAAAISGVGVWLQRVHGGAAASNAGNDGFKSRVGILLGAASGDVDAGVRTEACRALKRFVRSCTGGGTSAAVRSVQADIIKALSPMVGKGSGMAVDKLQAERALMYALNVVAGYDPALNNLEKGLPSDVVAIAPDLIRRLSRRLNEELWGGDSDNEE